MSAANEGAVQERASREALGDRAVPVTLEGPVSIGTGFRPYHRFIVTLPGAGGAPLTQTRDILRVGPVVACLAWDPRADLFVLIRQFRLAAHVAIGRGELVEIAAGRIEEGEAAEAAVRRECREELGVEPMALMPMMSFLPTPGVTDEHAELFLALIDSALVPAEAGEPGETEHTRPFLLPAADAMAALTAPAPGLVGNVFTLAALQWFALNRARAEAFAAGYVPTKQQHGRPLSPG